MGWGTVWQIAGQRNETRQGNDHLSQHAFDVLEQFTRNEATAAMAEAVGGFMQMFTVE